MGVASEVLQVGGIPGRRGRAAGMRSVALCHPGSRQPSPGLASLLPDHPLPNTNRGRTHLCNTESRGSHHTVPCTRIASGTTMGELRQFIHVLHSAITGRTGCSQLLQYDDSTCRNTAFRVFKAQLGLSLSNGPFARPWRSSGWETYSMYCKPLTVARHARAVHCNAMQFCEHTRTKGEGGTWRLGQTREP